jgi:citrate synthase
MNTQTPTSNGLDGQSIGTSKLSLVDGENGQLIICGYSVETLAAEQTFEEVSFLLSHNRLPNLEELRKLQTELSKKRNVIFDRLKLFDQAFELKDPMDSLRAAVAMLSPEASTDETATLLLAAIPVFIGAWHNRKFQTVLRRPAGIQTTAEAILHALNIEESGVIAKSLDKYLVTVSDHGMNASTFTARVIASTQSDAVSAITGAIGALKGPLHGGAPGPVLTMLDQIGTKERAAAWIEAKLARNERIMGMGHRIYRVRDPRAAVFERVISQLPTGQQRTERLSLARVVEKEAEMQLLAKKPDRPIKANVEFYTAVLLESCLIPSELFTAIFAAGRTAGWLAHIKEQQETGKLIRPNVDYIGAQPSVNFEVDSFELKATAL